MMPKLINEFKFEVRKVLQKSCTVIELKKAFFFSTKCWLAPNKTHNTKGNQGLDFKWQKLMVVERSVCRLSMIWGGGGSLIKGTFRNNCECCPVLHSIKSDCNDCHDLLFTYVRNVDIFHEGSQVVLTSKCWTVGAWGPIDKDLLLEQIMSLFCCFFCCCWTFAPLPGHPLLPLALAKVKGASIGYDHTCKVSKGFLGLKQSLDIKGGYAALHFQWVQIERDHWVFCQFFGCCWIPGSYLNQLYLVEFQWIPLDFIESYRNLLVSIRSSKIIVTGNSL